MGGKFEGISEACVWGGVSTWGENLRDVSLVFAWNETR